MASEKSVSEADAVAAACAAAAGAAYHARSFKLRFAPHHLPGRSHLSLVKPLGLPAPVSDKFHTHEYAAPPGPAVEAALHRVRRSFSDGPREKYTAPELSSHEYGWWPAPPPPPSVMRHHIRDSPWLRERLRLLAEPRYM